MASSSDSFGSFVVGVALGVVAGILVAPKSGKETREDLSNKLNDLRDEVNKTTSDLQKKAQEIKDEIDKEVKTGGKGIKSKLSEKLKELEDRIDEQINSAESKINKE